MKTVTDSIKPVVESRPVFASPWLALLVVVRNGWRRDERPARKPEKPEAPKSN